MSSIMSVLKNLEMWGRQRIPTSLRQFYRALNLISDVSSSAETVPQHLLDDCKFIASRSAMIRRLPAHAVVAEVGTLEGKFARKIISISEPSELHLIDINFSKFKEESLSGDRVFLHEGLSHEVLATFEDNYFDWVYIDAEHTYEAVRRDAERAIHKIKPGGFMVFNDFAHISPAGGRFGVHRAVVDVSIKYEWKWKYFAYQKSALYDIALQKPL